MSVDQALPMYVAAACQAIQVHLGPLTSGATMQPSLSAVPMEYSMIRRPMWTVEVPPVCLVETASDAPIHLIASSTHVWMGHARQPIRLVRRIVLVQGHVHSSV